MSKDNSGPAFPRAGFSGPGGYGRPDNGMTLRDWFAGQALAQASREIWANHKYEDVASRAYGLADAMLAERTK